jgi:hypothetical protein
MSFIINWTMLAITYSTTRLCQPLPVVQLGKVNVVQLGYASYCVKYNCTMLVTGYSNTHLC